MPRKPTPKPKAAALPSPPAATQPLIVSPSVPVLGVFVDPATSTVRNLPGNITVERAVGHCVVDVTSKISRKFELAPPLDPGSMTVKVYPAAVGNEDPLTVTQPGGLITLISPNDTAIRRLAEKERENRALRARDFNQATQPPPPVLPMHPAPSPAGQDDTTDVLKMMMERLNKQDAAIKEQGAELKAQRAELKAQRGENEIQATVITELQTSLLDQKRINERQEMKIRKLEATIEDQETTIADLQTALANEQEERKEEMRREKLERKGEMEYICQITAILVPLRLRILLDLARDKLTVLLGYKNWDHFTRDRHEVGKELLTFITAEITRLGISCALPCETIEFICASSKIRQQGNAAAHQAKQGDIRDAVMSESLSGSDRRMMKQIYEFKFAESAGEDGDDAKV